MIEPRPPTYCIPAWPEAFESAASRKLKSPQLCFHPNRAGRGMRRLARLEDGAAIYGCFVALCNVQSARRPDQRLAGWLTDDGTEAGEPWTADDMEDFTGFDAEIFERMLAVLSAPRIGWLSVSATSLADSPNEVADSPNEVADSPNEVAEVRHRKKERKKEGKKERQKESESVSSPSLNSISETKTMGDDIADSDSEAEPEAVTVSDSETDSAMSSSPPVILESPILNPRAAPSENERQCQQIQAEIDDRRKARRLAPIAGHMATAPISTALREPGVTVDKLLGIVAFEFAKYDAADDKQRREVVTHLTARNLFNSRYLGDAIDRALRYADDPDGWNFNAGDNDAELRAELAAFNARY